MFAVNGAMIYSALSTYSGVVATEPYRKGLHYNERILADERQRAAATGRDTLTIERDGRVELLTHDADGHPIRASASSVHRPAIHQPGRRQARSSLRRARSLRGAHCTAGRRALDRHASKRGLPTRLSSPSFAQGDAYGWQP